MCGAWRCVDALVCADTSRLERLAAHLLIFVGDEVDAEGEVVDAGALAAEVEDADFGVWYTAVEAGFGVWLYRLSESLLL